MDIGNATTEVVFVADGAPTHHPGSLLAARRVSTRGRKGSASSLEGAAALVRRMEREVGVTVDEVRIAPLRAVDTSAVVAAGPAIATGRFRLLAAGVATPGGRGAFTGVPVPLDAPARTDIGVVAVVPPGYGYRQAASRLHELADSGARIGAVLVCGDEAVLIANRVPSPLPVIDQADAAAALACSLVAVEVRPPGQPMTLLTDPVALAAAFGVSDGALELCKMLPDYSNAVVGLAAESMAKGTEVTGVMVEDDVDRFTVNLAEVADAATARRGSVGTAVLTAVLRRAEAGHEERFAGLLGRPVRVLRSEAAAARAGALTTPGADPDAWVADLGAGTIDVIAGDERELVLAGGGDLLTAAVAEALGVPRAAADWIKRGPALRVDGGTRYEAEDGSRGFLPRAAPAASGMLAVPGPGGLLPFGARHSPAEWRAVRIRLKQATVAANLARGLRNIGGSPRQLILVGGPAEDDELAGVLMRSLPGTIAVGRGNVGGGPLGCRYAAALGLALGDT